MPEGRDVKFGEIVCLWAPDDGGYVFGDDGITERLFLDADEYQNCPVHMLQSCCFTIVQKFQYAAAKAFQKRLRSEEVSKLKLTFQLEVCS